MDATLLIALLFFFFSCCAKILAAHPRLKKIIIDRATKEN